MFSSLQFRPRAVVIDSVARLLADLKRLLAQPQSSAERVHAIRVCCKKLRSWIRLLRGTRGTAERNRADKALRKLAGTFAAQRDETVMQQTLAELQSNSRSDGSRAACRQVLSCMRKRARAADTLRTAALPERVTRALLADAGFTRKTLKSGLRSAHARCVSLARPSSEASSRRLHRLRRWVKYMAYQLELATVPTPHREQSREQLLSLGRILGRIHDLAVLQERLRTVDFPCHDAVALVMARARRLERQLTLRAELQARAIFGLA